MGERPGATWLESLGEEAAGLPFERRTLHFGQELWAQGATAPGLAFIASGRARLLMDVAGNPAHVLTLHDGDVAGLCSLVEGGREPVTLRASSAATEIWLLPLEPAQALLADPRVREALLARKQQRRKLIGWRSLPGVTECSDPAIVALAEASELIELRNGQHHNARADRPGDFEAVLAGQLRPRDERVTRPLRAGDLVFPALLPTSAPLVATQATTVLRAEHTATLPLVEAHPELHDVLMPASGLVERATTEVFEEPRAPDVEGELDLRGPGRRIRRIPWVGQLDAADCGAASLSIVCRYFGRRISLSVLRRMLFAGKDGVHLRALCHAARNLGLAARSAKISEQNLDDLPVPAIVHLDGNHWAVLYEVRGQRVRLSDPGAGRVNLSRAAFLERWDGFTALFDYTDDFGQESDPEPSNAWLWPFIRPWVGVVGQAALLAGVVASVEAALPICTQVIIDTVLVDHDTGLLVGMAGALGVALVFLVLSMLLQRYLLSFVAVRIDGGALDFLARRLLDLHVSYFATRRIGDIRRRLEGVRGVREFVVGNSVRMLTAVAKLLGALTLLGIYSPSLLLLLLCTTPAYALVMKVSARLLGPLFTQLERGFAEYDSHQIDAIRGIETVKAMGAEGALRQRMLDAFHKLAVRQFRADFSMLAYDAGVSALNFLIMATFLVLGAWKAMEGELTVGALVAVNALVAMASAPISTLLRAWDDAQRARVLLARIQDVLVEEPEQGRDRSHLIPVPKVLGDIRLSAVSFAFPAVDAKPVLRDLELHIRPGMTVALVGRSGCGKSTLAKCVAGLLAPTQGRIIIDGVDLTRMNLADYRRNIGVVLQETHLFDGTIASNIALSDETPDMDRVIRAARIACAASFIEELPAAYETRVGESGMGLSGGQTQRLSIARALYHDPQLLILDEATSALDVETDLALQDNLRAWRQGKTCIIVAHRLSTVRDADLTVVLEHGRIVEQGTHRQLQEQQGMYHQL
ncbi:MAG: ATP-binding cassette domain-containing protein, partial [Nannocystaceae bacterium]|nr:ATP-binding cassette domain-containing protein [Nannocystaceae bacterium]